jgi:hypothetical protein
MTHLDAGAPPSASASLGAPLGSETPTEAWVVWSNYHGAWWGPNCSGYEPSLLLAGCYTEAEARKIERSRSREPGMMEPERAVLLAEALEAERASRRSTAKVPDLLLSALASTPALRWPAPLADPSTATTPSPFAEMIHAVREP